MLVPQTYISGALSISSPSPASEEGGASSVDEGVAAVVGVVEDLLPRPRPRFSYQKILSSYMLIVMLVLLTSGGESWARIHPAPAQVEDGGSEVEKVANSVVVDGQIRGFRKVDNNHIFAKRGAPLSGPSRKGHKHDKISSQGK
ncbi:unnamed protein product [Fraxinus pennsylvanica]|uniref:Uncharacterized protein n=1 Tax=Fraxinus pennsylvanica TaxID=56036 RepID=A0AAD2EER9_9LAMI|nr:unnamed protein product [Fraxinus pennsylvanica]